MAEPTMGELLASVTQLMQRYNLTMDQFNTWLTGSGTVTLIDAAGGQRTVPSASNVLRSDGSNASGTWPISINGQAATVRSITAQQISAALGAPALHADNIPSTDADRVYVRLGTFAAAQNGAKLRVSIMYSQGFTAGSDQIGMAELVFATSNGARSQPGSSGPFFGAGIAYAFGNASLQFVVLQNSQALYTVYAIMQPWSGACSCNAWGDTTNGGWTSNIQNTGTAAPAGNCIIIPVRVMQTA
ncbi:hypothetical protein VL04_17685 [Chromobacterium violaceum]|uniref:hypothetical protein n=1 Tax=Chromobacterium violaceum TaxID=536 RepID=UPI0006534A1D|nr:hypothetical protein [Chromobacterium violaceum]KMN48791.1 hypothetical protein VK93_14950 [Chromobacterium violaceum]KMN87886.1 hypothetical protein VL02_00945 [Chromobacterium violaceum]KMN89115.1 hypothetical protein VL04_17685 [Chromobacterium violaceum]KMO05489.1 hypothetical protein VL16_02930 [Chromobacterium violaceum]